MQRVEQRGYQLEFVDFARAHGVVIDYNPPIGQWKRYKTEDKPTHRNGAVKFMGDHGFVQNHATMNEVAIWQCDGDSKINLQEIRKNAAKAERDIAIAQAKASEKAEWILSQCRTTVHPYLEKKGFQDERINTWKTESGLVAVIPMRIGSKVVGCQMISESGDKKFLFGQRTSNAQFVFANGGMDILCEGYATALSVRHALKNAKRQYTLHVCFSAGNLKKVAQNLKSGIVIADNDQSGTGERVAKEIGWPYWMSDTIGEDANDYHLRKGIFSLSQGVSKLMMGVK